MHWREYPTETLTIYQDKILPLKKKWEDGKSEHCSIKNESNKYFFFSFFRIFQTARSGSPYYPKLLMESISRQAGLLWFFIPGKHGVYLSLNEQINRRGFTMKSGCRFDRLQFGRYKLSFRCLIHLYLWFIRLCFGLPIRCMGISSKMMSEVHLYMLHRSNLRNQCNGLFNLLVGIIHIPGWRNFRLYWLWARIYYYFHWGWMSMCRVFGLRIGSIILSINQKCPRSYLNSPSAGLWGRLLLRFLQ